MQDESKVAFDPAGQVDHVKTDPSIKPQANRHILAGCESKQDEDERARGEICNISKVDASGFMIVEPSVVVQRDAEVSNIDGHIE